MPYLLKDLLIERAGTPFTDGSRFLAGNVSTGTSELATRLERAGLIILGRTNTSEFGMAPTCEPVLYGPTRNPWSIDHSTSGSSGRLGSGRRVGDGADGARTSSRPITTVTRSPHKARPLNWTPCCVSCRRPAGWAVGPAAG